jgi:hypothetical protein
LTNQPALRASDAEREHTVELLRRHSIDGRLTLEEFAQRMSTAYEARTREELDELVRDLPVDLPTTPTPRRRPTRWVVAVMGGANRTGRLRVGKRTTMVSVMGGVNLDLRQAELAQPEVTITILSLMGGANVIVPEGVDVELSGLAIMGGKGHRAGKQPIPPGAPLVRVRAFALMGGVSVITKR